MFYKATKEESFGAPFFWFFAYFREESIALQQVVMICFARAYMQLFFPDHSLLPRIRVTSISPQRTQRSAKAKQNNEGKCQ
ncbi:MAG: hypothetical protein COW18_07550 [Zetaproteobacteria bacterium CG12_big_fil_rev_8_21_14_0_65_54_13]|nr:MAG: hypothetical protein COX55_06985 [Zetaproteobacteria bacterium CG23_combo_of_CG06-09_8_20_14_all_54_7]PIW48150.1 MAG: hypothetical protein COW18_07550 [Zetaproteobacteria bacterium CG12_big_fil_rev_8_21_14_0_65_54_13]PIX55232.1 MAG: hypothetical protein COZ50_04025 [Zetaproteobacteria bacterium CG_4_10_14_3_um_filter_54_28]PJA28115.1 MAG: hypothetical protein CO188_10690 [Zetaproteobacteria bacterium CG_4_9_14_3_um_filter_54_145]